MSRLLVLFAIGLTTACSVPDPPPPLRIDAGPAGAPVDPGFAPLPPGDRYTPASGLGWTDPPDRSFTQSRLARSRSALTIDGVQGDRLGFRADVPPGVWWLTLWIEAGREDSSTVALRIGEEERATRWHPFLPPAEPRTGLQKIYRLYHGRVDVTTDGFSFELVGGRDSVRVLGFTLRPDAQPDTRARQRLWRRLEAAGRYTPDLALDRMLADDGAGLDSLLAELAPLREQGDAFAAYWHEQVRLLALAERHLRGMGWEHVQEATGLGMFDRYHQAVMLLDGLLARSESPLYERALFQRGRLLYWLGKERHGPHEIAGGRRDLAALFERHPGDTLLAVYNGHPVDLPDACDALSYAPGAPHWSILQREALCRLREEVAWWVRARQIESGELGGKLGDDVELLRWWPALILAGDTTALHGWKRLADGVWQSPHVADGYAAEAADVEHASEFIADSAPEMALYSDDPRYTDRLRPSARYVATRWTARTPSGRRHFRSSWFGTEELDERPPRNRDVPMNTRAVKAARYLAWKTGDPGLVDLLHEWAAAWAHAAARTDKGKPAGLIPPSIRFPDEALNGDAPTWYDAGMFWDYYDWEAGQGVMMLDQLLFTFTLTRDARLLEPLLAALDLVRALGDAPDGNAARGSAAWAALLLRANASFWNVAEQWRLHTGDARRDSLLTRYGTPYLRFRLTGREDPLEEGLTELLDAVRFHTPLRTTEVLHTDRVRTPGANHLKAMLTGSGVREGSSPYYAVSWEDTDDAFTALVADAGPGRLAVHLFSHASVPRTVQMRLWLLEPGTYRRIETTGGRPEQEDTLSVSGRGQRVPVTLPPGAALTLVLEPATP